MEAHCTGLSYNCKGAFSHLELYFKTRILLNIEDTSEISKNTKKSISGWKCFLNANLNTWSPWRSCSWGGWGRWRATCRWTPDESNWCRTLRQVALSEETGCTWCRWGPSSDRWCRRWRPLEARSCCPRWWCSASQSLWSPQRTWAEVKATKNHSSSIPILTLNCDKY